VGLQHPETLAAHPARAARRPPILDPDVQGAGQAELAPLRAGRYDGIKACFLDAGGVVFVGDMPSADATVGNCKILKFDPGQDVNRKIEFVGALDAVTVVRTAPYLQAKG
jgi:hypothetical protein